MGYGDETQYDEPYLQANDAYGAGGGPGQVFGYNSDGSVQSAPGTSGANSIGAGASGLGQLTSLLPKLLGERKQRVYAAKIAGVQHEMEAKQYANQLENSGIDEAVAEHQNAIATPALAASLDARGFGGMNKSSIMDQTMAEQAYRQNLGLDAIRRQRALLVAGRQAQLDTQSLQRQAQKSAVLYDTLSQATAAIGSAAGAAAGAFASDPKLKENIKPMKKGVALEMVVQTPVKEWNYKADKVNPRMGPMADDIKKNMGEEVSDGHQIDAVSMNGMLMQAIKDLTQKVMELEGKLNAR